MMIGNQKFNIGDAVRIAHTNTILDGIEGIIISEQIEDDLELYIIQFGNLHTRFVYGSELEKIKEEI